MTTAELVRIVGKRSEVAQKSVIPVISEVQQVWAAQLAEGKSVVIQGIGTLSVTTRAARDGRNPRTGKKIKIAARQTLKFKAFPSIKKAINGEEEE